MTKIKSEDPRNYFQTHEKGKITIRWRQTEVIIYKGHPVPYSDPFTEPYYALYLKNGLVTEQRPLT